jgi:hypothetical protein
LILSDFNEKHIKNAQIVAQRANKIKNLANNQKNSRVEGNMQKNNIATCFRPKCRILQQIVSQSTIRADCVDAAMVLDVARRCSTLLDVARRCSTLLDVARRRSTLRV